MAILRHNPYSRRWALKYFLQTLLSPMNLASNPTAPSILVRLPLSAAPHANLAPLTDTILLDLARNPPSAASSSFSEYLESDIVSSDKQRIDEQPRWWKILYAHRISRSDYRGAAEGLWEWLHRLRASPHNPRIGSREETDIERVFLLLINALETVAPEQAWILAEVPGTKTQNGSLGAGLGARGKKERKIVTLEDVRKEYSTYLDQLDAVEQGRFAFVERDTEGDVSML